MTQDIRISYLVKYLPCEDANCISCLTGKGHGPYWYAQYDLNGEAKNVFLGKEFRPLDLQKVILQNADSHQPSHEHESTQEKAAEQATQNDTKTAPEKKSNHIDHVDLSGVRKVKRNRASVGTMPLPTRAEFEQDLKILQGAAIGENLKIVYRKMIKKYHPDRFGGDHVMNHWMSEINTQYHQLSRYP